MSLEGPVAAPVDALGVPEVDRVGDTIDEILQEMGGLSDLVLRGFALGDIESREGHALGRIRRVQRGQGDDGLDDAAVLAPPARLYHP